MTRTLPSSALIPLVVAVVALPVLSGAAAAFPGGSAPVGPDAGVDDVPPANDEHGATASAANPNIPDGEGVDTGDAAKLGTDHTLSTNASILGLVKLNGDWPLGSTAGGTLASGTGVSSPVGPSGAVLELLSSTSTESDDQATVSDGDDPGSTRPAGAPTGPQDESSEGAPVGMALGGFVLATAIGRSALVGGMAIAAPLTTMPTRQGLLERIGLLFYPLRYSRYDDSDPLEHDTRQRVHEIVESTPGTYLSAISEETDVPLSTARHHVRVLEREGLVASAKVRGKRRFYPVGLEEVARAAAIDDGAASVVLQALARLGPCSVADLADELDRDSSTITYHLQRLEEDDLVERERNGRAVENRLVEPLRSTFEPEGPTRHPVEAIVGPADD